MESTQRQAQARRYETIHNWLFVVDAILSVALLLAFLLSGLSAALADRARALTPNPWLYVPAYATVALVASKLLFLPLNYFGDFWLEHRFGLSTERWTGWAWDQAKSLALNLVLGIAVLEVIYFLLRRAGDWWWLGAGAFMLVLGVGLSTVYPVLILPLFYKLEPLENEDLRRRLVDLATRVGVRVVGVYRMALSEKTKKANAAFAGLGATRRIILGDTLIEKFEPDEVEVVLAHEMAHYHHRDMPRLIAWSALTILGGLWLADLALRFGLTRFGFDGRSDIGGFPLLTLCLFAFGLVVMPANNAFSRWRERLADRAALDLTGNPAAFIRAMRKLADQNLADKSPPAWIELLLHDHPSLQRRIELAESWRRA